jgi:hypothetical protein
MLTSLQALWVGSLWIIISPVAAFAYGAVLSFIATFLLFGIMKM